MLWIPVWILLFLSEVGSKMVGCVGWWVEGRGCVGDLGRDEKVWDVGFWMSKEHNEGIWIERPFQIVAKTNCRTNQQGSVAGYTHRTDSWVVAWSELANVVWWRLKGGKELMAFMREWLWQARECKLGRWRRWGCEGDKDLLPPSFKCAHSST